MDKRRAIKLARQRNRELAAISDQALLDLIGLVERPSMADERRMMWEEVQRMLPPGGTIAFEDEPGPARPNDKTTERLEQYEEQVELPPPGLRAFTQAEYRTLPIGTHQLPGRLVCVRETDETLDWEVMADGLLEVEVLPAGQRARSRKQSHLEYSLPTHPDIRYLTEYDLDQELSMESDGEHFVLRLYKPL